jgi:PAS domain S-box-containing protein
VGIVGLSHDITTLKQAEEALRQSDERFALAVRGSNDGIWDHDMANNTLYWSPHMFELYGLDPDELDVSFDKFESRLHSDDEEQVKAAIAAHLKDRVPYDVEHRGRIKSGEYRWFRERGQAVWDETGRPVRTVGSTTDITERKQMETALAEERNLLRTLIDNLPDNIYVKDTEGRHLIVNHTVIKGRGLATIEEVIGKTDPEIYPLEAAQQWYADDMTVIQSGQPLLNREELLFEGIKHVGWSLTSKIPLYDSHGNVVGLVGVTRDITEQKRAALELQQAKEVAETATRVKSEFLANMSHEIRTPLNAVIGMTSLLLDTSLTSEQHDFAETIRTSGDNLLTVINDILDFSKIEAGKLELETQPFDLRQCIEESLDLVAIKAAEKKLELAYLIDDSTPSALVGDVTRLRQILVNLLNNAVKFTDQGEIVLSVRSHLLKPKRAETQESQAGDIQSPPPLYEVHVVVRDTGIGIPPDRMDRLFRSFSQVDASTTRKYGGTGLGLTISKRLSELMGGGMWVESEGVPGQGSIFHFTLLAPAAPSQSRIYLRGKNPELTGKHLLIVDDNATNRLILARQAQAWGMRPRAAAAAEEALAWIRRGDSFDLAILDMQMPYMDGLTLAAEIRKYRTAQTLPLVMLTSLGQRENKDQSSPVEFAAFLTKPIKPSHLYNILGGIFEDQPVKIKPDSPRSSSLDHELGQRHPLRILLAEDNAVNQKVALYLLERLGYLADVAANGLEVLEALQRQPYDVVLMDVQMPEMDGLEATQHILAQWPAAQRPWIVAMTANALQGDRERCLEAGMNDYISKPVRPEELTRALSQCQPRARRVEVEVSTEPEVSAGRNTGATPVTQGVPVLEAAVLAELEELLGEHAPQMIAELIDLFFETARPLLEEMRTAVRKEDGLGLRRGAHTIRPGSAHLGAIRLAVLSEELETMGETGQLDEAAAKLAELEAEFSRVKIALEAEKRGSNG